MSLNNCLARELIVGLGRVRRSRLTSVLKWEQRPMSSPQTSQNPTCQYPSQLDEKLLKFKSRQVRATMSKAPRSVSGPLGPKLSSNLFGDIMVPSIE